MKHFKLTSESKVNSFGVNLLKSELTIDCEVGKGRRQRRMDWGRKTCLAMRGCMAMRRCHGNAWVSGNAWVYGDARVSSNARGVYRQCGGVWQCVRCLAMRGVSSNAVGVWQCGGVWRCVGVWQCVGVWRCVGVWQCVRCSGNAWSVWQCAGVWRCVGGIKSRLLPLQSFGSENQNLYFQNKTKEIAVKCGCFWR